jgi:metallo-beta-lactamase family protein
MKIAFHGAARTVTGSKHLLTLKSGAKILLDCGMFQGLGKETDVLNANFGFEASSINYLILSHAHVDHSGLIPKLVKEGFTGKIFCTDATERLTDVLLADSAEIQRDDIKFQPAASPAFPCVYSKISYRLFEFRRCRLTKHWLSVPLHRYKKFFR